MVLLYGLLRLESLRKESSTKNSALIEEKSLLGGLSTNPFNRRKFKARGRLDRGTYFFTGGDSGLKLQTHSCYARTTLMSIRGKAAIVGIGETPADRLGSKPGEPRQTAAQYLAAGARLALADAGLRIKDLDGQGLAAVMVSTYPQPFWPGEAAEVLGISPGLLISGGQGGASAVSVLGQAAAAIASGLVDLVLCVAAAAPFVESYPGPGSAETRDFEAPFGVMGPNSKIAHVMRRHMHEYGSTAEHFGKIAVTARYHASLNPSAYLRTPITLEEYKKSRLVADPIRLLDCVMPANGGKAYVVASAERARKLAKPPVYILGFGERDNPHYGAKTHSNALIMGISDSGKTAMEMAGVRHQDVNFLQLYDDYIVIVLMQIEDLGFCAKGDMGYFDQIGRASCRERM